MKHWLETHRSSSKYNGKTLYLLFLFELRLEHVSNIIAVSFRVSFRCSLAQNHYYFIPPKLTQTTVEWHLFGNDARWVILL